MKALLYCTKSKPKLPRSCATLCENDEEKHINFDFTSYNGHIIAECDIEKVEEIKPFFCENVEEFEKKTCLTMRQVYKYLGIGLNELLFNIYTRTKPYGYALHLSNIKEFNKLKKLSYSTLDNNAEFYTKRWDKVFKTWRCGALTKAPQNMCKVYDINCNEYILISIHPKWIQKILNGEKTIEVRKKILNCLKEEK